MENHHREPFDGKHAELTGRILNRFYFVYTNLGYGFTEKVYQRALAIELVKVGLSIAEQKPIHVFYDNQMIGDFFADMVVNDLVILELKCTRQIMDVHVAQLDNYLKSTRYEVGLLLNFGQNPTHKRRVYDNEKKGTMKWLEKSELE
jgi:GxxExxY protein